MRAGGDVVAPLTFGSASVLRVTEPFDGGTLMRFLGRFAVPSAERHDTTGGHPRLTRTVRLTHGPGLIRLTWTGPALRWEYAGPAADRAEAVRRTEALCDADADVAAVSQRLAADPHLGPLVASGPGLRIPGGTDPAEVALQALISQQVSMAAAARCADKLTVRYGEQIEVPAGAPDRLFPTAAALSAVDPAELPMPRARGRALVALAGAIAAGTLVLDPERPWPELRAALLARPGIGPWTADVIGLRGLRQPDVLLDTDLVIRRELATRGVSDTQRWSPWRSYATVHLWRAYV